jgi:hypothetical protein
VPARTPAIAAAAERVGQFILIIRRQRVLLDEDLAALYGVETRSLVQAVKRNLERFPPDFMFELSAAEWVALRSQSVTSKSGRGGRRYSPYAFTEQGVAMLSSVLNSDRAIAVNIEIMRSFVRIRRLLEADKSLARKFDRLEQKFTSHDQAIVGILAAIRQLMNPTEPKRRGFAIVLPSEFVLKLGAPRPHSAVDACSLRTTLRENRNQSPAKLPVSSRNLAGEQRA